MLNLQEILQKSKESKAEREFIQRVHHTLMKEYGYIPFEEFKNLPMPTVFNLLKMIEEDYKSQEREMDKIKSKGRRR